MVFHFCFINKTVNFLMKKKKNEGDRVEKCVYILIYLYVQREANETNKFTGISSRT